MRSLRILTTIAVLGLFASGCASTKGRQPSNGATEEKTAEAYEVPIDWEHPLGGPQFMSASAAQPTVPFQIVVPKWGHPDVVETLPNVANVPAPAFVLAMVFHLPEEGTVLLREQLQNMDSLEHLKELADTNFGSLSREPSPSPGVPDPVQLVPLRGTEGLLVQAHGVGRIVWLENGIRFDITGPTVTPDQVVALAEAL